jgi:Tfp pilus assembly protein PilN
MLKSNLSTRPFYNERAVHLGLALAAAVVLAVTGFNARALVALSARNTALAAGIARDEAAAADLARRAEAIRRGTDRKEIDAISAAAREANDLIAQRTFSWTELFNLIEATLPPDVMLTAVRPQVRDGEVTVTMGVVGRRSENLDAFMAALEKTGAFADLLPRQENVADDRLHHAVLNGRYLGPPPPAGASPKAPVAPAAPAKDGRAGL